MAWKLGKAWQQKRKAQPNTVFRPAAKLKEQFRIRDRVCFRATRIASGKRLWVYGLGYIVDLQAQPVRHQGRTVGFRYVADIWPEFQIEARSEANREARHAQMEHFFDQFIYPTVASRHTKAPELEIQAGLPSSAGVVMGLLERLNAASFRARPLPISIPKEEVLRRIPDQDFCLASYEALRQKSEEWLQTL